MKNGGGGIKKKEKVVRGRESWKKAVKKKIRKQEVGGGEGEDGGERDAVQPSWVVLFRDWMCSLVVIRRIFKVLLIAAPRCPLSRNKQTARFFSRSGQGER